MRNIPHADSKESTRWAPEGIKLICEFCGRVGTDQSVDLEMIGHITVVSCEECSTIPPARRTKKNDAT